MERLAKQLAAAATGPVRWCALLLVCAAYLQGGLTKLFAFDGAVSEMQHFGLQPAAPFALAVILLELAASLAILTGRGRWAGAMILAGFTFAANFIANRFWELSGQESVMVANGFFEHLGLCGAFILIAWHDLRARCEAPRAPAPSTG